MRDATLPDLTGRGVLVTGASGQVGRGIALRFAAAGAVVAAHGNDHGHDVESLVEHIRAQGGSAVAVLADLRDEAGCRHAVETAAAWLGSLDVLVNAAGVQPVQDLGLMTDGMWREVVDTNLTSVFRCTRFAAELMPRPGGSIVHIGSIEGTQPAPGHAHYCSSKAAVIMHARAAALEYGRFGIRVNSVSPGLIERPGLDRSWPEGVGRWRRAAPLRRLGRGEDVGDACVFLASPMASWITGHDLRVDGGVSAHPTW